jgi:hypothetical protein
MPTFRISVLKLFDGILMLLLLELMNEFSERGNHYTGYIGQEVGLIVGFLVGRIYPETIGFLVGTGYAGIVGFGVGIG